MISYKAPSSYSVITSVSTLVAKFTEEDFELSEAEEIVSQYLLLSDDIELSTFEPLREIQNDIQRAKEFVLKSTKLSNILNHGARFLQVVSGNRVSRIKGADLVVAAIKNKILEVEQSGRRSNDAPDFDLNDPSVLLDVFGSAETLSESVIDEIDTDDVFNSDSSVRANCPKASRKLLKLEMNRFSMNWSVRLLLRMMRWKNCLNPQILHRKNLKYSPVLRRVSG